MGKHDWFREEFGFHQPNTERGAEAWDSYEKRGPILFLGGPIHGRFMTMRDWPAIWLVRRPYPKPNVHAWTDPDPFQPVDQEPCKYGLARARTPGGGLAYVYIATDDVRTAWPEELENETCRKVSAMFARMATRMFSDMMFARRSAPGQWAASLELEFGRLCAIESGPMDDEPRNRIRD